jgi:transcriptional regulator with XRE-family HTH domain
MTSKKERHAGVQELILNIAEKIKLSRAEKQISQIELAQAMGCSVRYVKRMECGDVDFRLHTLSLLHEILGVTLVGKPAIHGIGSMAATLQ